MGKYHFLVFVLVCANAMAASPLVLKMEGKFVDVTDGARTAHEWSHIVYAQPGEPMVADEAKRKHCSGKDCLTEEFRTEVTAERTAPDLIQAKVTFHRKLGDESTRIDGTVYARPGDKGEFHVDTNQDSKQRYSLKVSPVVDAKR
jgi:hypothetical protein